MVEQQLADGATGHRLQDAAQGDNAAPPPKTIFGVTYTTAFKLLLVLLLVVFIVLGITVWDLDKRIKSLLEWLEENKVQGVAIFIAIYAGLTGALLFSVIVSCKYVLECPCSVMAFTVRLDIDCKLNYAWAAAVFFPSSILTLAGGAIYSFWGIPMVWFAATVGQTLAFLLARYLLHDLVLFPHHLCCHEHIHCPNFACSEAF